MRETDQVYCGRPLSQKKNNQNLSGSVIHGISYLRYQACFQLWLSKEYGGVCSPSGENRESRVSSGTPNSFRYILYFVWSPLCVWIVIGWNFYFRKTGKSITLITRSDWRSAAHLIEILEEANQVKAQNATMSIGNGRIACEFILYISFCSNSYGLLQ